MMSLAGMSRPSRRTITAQWPEGGSTRQKNHTNTNVTTPITARINAPINPNRPPSNPYRPPPPPSFPRPVYPPRSYPIKTHGYYRFPPIPNHPGVFTSEDDLWPVSAGGGVARRLTSGLGSAGNAAAGGDGPEIVYAGEDDGVIVNCGE